MLRLTTSIFALALAMGLPAPLLAQNADTPAMPQMGMGVSADRALPADQVPTLAGEDAGAYLAAGYAATRSDFQSALDYFERALQADPGNQAMQETALLARVALGRVDEAIERAQTMADQGATHMIGQILGLAKAAKAGDFAGVLALLDQGDAAAKAAAQETPPANGGTDAAPQIDLIAELVRAWAQVGQGQMSEAVKGFDRVIAQPGATPFGRYHKALALASVGDFEGANALLTGQDGEELRLTRRGLVAHAQILSQLEKNDDAIALLDSALKVEADPVLSSLRDRLAAGEAVPFDTVTSASDGLGEVYFNFAGMMLGGDVPDASTLVYARIAAWLTPANLDAQMLAAALLEQMEQFDLAVQAYEAVPQDSPMRAIADLGRAQALRRAGQVEQGIDVAQAVTKAHPDLITGWLSLGDMLRQDSQFAKAAPAYDKAIDLAEKTGGASWFLYYARGVAHERSKQWPKAEADFRKAIELSPEQPEALNYLGYALVDRNEKLDEALSLIKAAVEASPEDGYIQDSLGWAYFRLGRYDEAVAPMELAIARMADDPLVNDHLGDVYWAVGREREARVQWRRALSLIPAGAQTADEVDPDRVRRKIEVGLDQVLKDEGAKPLHAD
ncbi:tetratricopeptide repeat protein [Paracoccus sp. p4-l81]|uniref:tetratricopeptide repeat protein n=1 Tax=unclassified Paracoccus (in: a-proteobacteria) TaxID=2688777 RepID=UPI0035B90E1E